jgi:hypothetical protein
MTISAAVCPATRTTHNRRVQHLRTGRTSVSANFRAANGETKHMMDGSTLLIAAMIAMMVLMCGGMLVGGGWALRRRRRHPPDDRR